MDLGKRIAKARDDAKLSQGKLAALCGLSDGGSISAYERGSSTPSLAILVAIADHTGVSTDALLGRERDEKPDYSGLRKRHIQGAKDLAALPPALEQHFLSILQSLRPLATNTLLSQLLAYDPNNPRHEALMRDLEAEARQRAKKGAQKQP